MAPYLPENYLEMYPPTFHFTIPEVMDYYAQKIGFEVEKSGFLRRTYPERLRYLGSLPDVGEIAYGVYVKPKTPQFTLE